MKRRNSISGQFSARLIEMLESPAYRVLSRSAHMVISRVEIELAHHGGNDNGKLPITTEDFIAYGMDRGSVAPAIREAHSLGFVTVEQGRGGNAEHRKPTCLDRPSRSIVKAAAIRRPTIGARSRPSRKPSRSHAPLAKLKINARLNTENGAHESESKKQKPVGENLKYRLGKPQLKTPIPRLGKPQLQGQSKNPNHFLYLGVVSLTATARRQSRRHEWAKMEAMNGNHDQRRNCSLRPKKPQTPPASNIKIPRACCS